jgi:dihydrofolate reductase
LSSIAHSSTDFEIGGGATVLQQYLAACLLDEIVISLVRSSSTAAQGLFELNRQAEADAAGMRSDERSPERGRWPVPARPSCAAGRT